MKESINNKLVNLLIENYCEDELVSYGIATVLKKYSNLEDIGNDSLRKLTKIIDNIEDLSLKAAIIETIVEIPCFEYEKEYKLLDQYLNLLSINGGRSLEEVRNCLNAFIISGANKSDVFAKVYENLDKKYAIQILAGINYEEKEITDGLKNIYLEVRNVKKIKYRSNLISTFVLITNPLCLKYDYINCISFSYSESILAIVDWAWKEKGSTQYLVTQKIINRDEGKIFEELGMLLVDQDNLNNGKLKELYDKFFKGKNPFDVMFTLPI